MKKCKDCKCANCVKNANICLNTPTPCGDVCCDICNGKSMAINFCSGHFTLDQVNLMISLIKSGLSQKEAYEFVKNA